MDGSESYSKLAEDDRPDNSSIVNYPSRVRRQSSLIKSFTALKRVGSKLTTNRAVTSPAGSNFNSTTDLLDNLKQAPKLPKDGNASKISFFSSLNNRADHPNYSSSPVPDLDHKPEKKQVLSPKTGSKAPANKFGRKSFNRPPRSPFQEGDHRVPPFRRSTYAPTTDAAQPQRQRSRVSISTLMGPIQPGHDVGRGIPRSSTTGNMEARSTYMSQVRSFMRSTSSSAARQRTGIPIPSTATQANSRRPSVGQLSTLNIARPNTRGPRLSSSNSSRALRSQAQSDLPFRELYSPGEGKGQVASVAPYFMEPGYLPAGDPREARISEAPEVGPYGEAREAVSTLIDPEIGWNIRQYLKREEGPRSTAETPEWRNTPDYDSIEVAKACDARFEDMPGNTPLHLPGVKHKTCPASGFDMSVLRPNAFDSWHEESESHTTWGRESNTKQGKQRESMGGSKGVSFTGHNRQHETMGYYEEEGYTAPAKRCESIDNSEGDTIIRGGKGDTDTDADSIHSLLTRTNNSVSMALENGEDDPRNVYEAMDRGYWCGRISTLNDKYHNETIPIDRRDLDPKTDDASRIHRAFRELAQFCKTPEAKKSMNDYASEYRKIQGHQAPAPIGSTGFVRRPVAAATSQEKNAGEAGPSAKKQKKGGGMLGKLGLRRKSGV